MTQRMTILMDIDNVVFHTNRLLLELNNQANGTDYHYDDMTDWDWFGRTFPRPFYSLADPEFWKKVEADPEAFQYIQWANGMGWDVVFVTASNIVGEHMRAKIGRLTQELQKYDCLIDGCHLVTTSRKDLVDGQVFIDDCLAQCELWGKSHPDGRVVCYTQPWNHGYVGTNDWEIIGRLTQQAYEAYTKSN